MARWPARCCGLAPVGRLERQAEPAEILDHRRLEVGPAAFAVDILDAQQQAAAEGCRHALVLDALWAWPRCGQRSPFRLGAKRRTRNVRFRVAPAAMAKLWSRERVDARRDGDGHRDGTGSSHHAGSAFGAVPGDGAAPCGARPAAAAARRGSRGSSMSSCSSRSRRSRPRPSGGGRRRSCAPSHQERFATASDEDYRASGQSRPKVRTLRAVAAAVLDGTLDLESLPQRSAEERPRRARSG